MVICLERGADLHKAQLMLLPLTVSCFIKIQIGFAFLVPAHLGSPRKGPLNGCVCVVAVVAAAVLTVVVYRSTCISWHLQFRTGEFCWCKVFLLLACPC